MNYVIFGGINGSGKSSMYNSHNSIEKFELGIRVNVDEVVSMMGDWRDNELQFRASRQLINEIDYCLKNKLPFNQESTLSGKTIINTINKAKNLGYSVMLNYVYVDNIDILKARIEHRVNLGGHGIDFVLLEKRFLKIKDSLIKIIPLCDKVRIYNNTKIFKQVVDIESKKIIFFDDELVHFIKDTLNCLVNEKGFE